eukprot:scaffold292866_cov17-Tisochrysis_lutea.AAC.1
MHFLVSFPWKTSFDGDTVECYHYAFGEASHADEHILSFTNGGFVAHDVHPPHSPDAALSRALEQWGRDLLEKHGRRLHESGVSFLSLFGRIALRTTLIAEVLEKKEKIASLEYFRNL